MNMFNFKLEACHADTCLSGYWSGHHLPHLQTVVWHGMTLDELKAGLMSELNEGAICGSLDWEVSQSELLHAMMAQAIENITANHDGPLFTDLELNDEDDGLDSVYAFFVFRELN